MRLKYVLTDRKDFAIFTDSTAHRDIAKVLYGQPIGAGFCDIAVGYDDDNKNKINVHCWGNSVSLGIESNETDEQVINERLTNQY